MKISLGKHIFYEETKFLVLDIVKSGLVVALFTYFFYQSIYALPLTLVLGGFFWKNLKRKRRRKKEREFLAQFSECMQAVVVSMRAGYAVENGVIESIAEVRMMFGEGSRMEKELLLVKEGLRNNIAIEKLFLSMAENTGMDFVKDFATAFSIAKRSGGSIPTVISNFAGLIATRNSMEEEMSTLLSGKRMEQMIMNSMPFGILVYLECTNPGYFDSLYHNLTGVLIMSGCVLVYVLAYYLSERAFERLFEWER